MNPQLVIQITPKGSLHSLFTHPYTSLSGYWFYFCVTPLATACISVSSSPCPGLLLHFQGSVSPGTNPGITALTNRGRKQFLHGHTGTLNILSIFPCIPASSSGGSASCLTPVQNGLAFRRMNSESDELNLIRDLSGFAGFGPCPKFWFVIISLRVCGLTLPRS